jgi:predicted transglutaminase-like cysteine proteinase
VVGLVLAPILAALCVWALCWPGPARAEAVDLSPALAARLVGIGERVNRETPRMDAHHHGNCMLVAQRKMAAFRGAGVPASAMRIFAVKISPAASEFHALLLVEARVEGRPWRRLFDMNDPLPVDADREPFGGYYPAISFPRP